MLKRGRFVFLRVFSLHIMHFVKMKILFFSPTQLFEIKNLKKINRCPCTIEIVTIFTP